MDYYLTIWSVVTFIENRLQSGFEYDDLEKVTGFSIAHLRDLFSGHTGKTLSRYILGRRIANSAFDIIHTHENIFDIAVKYRFSNPDTFTRAFKRITGLTPKEFRLQRPTVGRRKICAGIYGVSERTEAMNNDVNNKEMTDGNTVLYGVPRAGYGVYGCTPFPICLKSVSNYLGEDVDYDYAMVSCGAAFRLVWDTTCWNGGNVDVLHTYDEPVLVYKNGIEALGREFKIIGRSNVLTQSDPAKFSSVEGKAGKEEFIAFIKEQIDKGHPCIALGIIGPPEACIVTGYRNNGNTLMGWNFFQDSPEFAGTVKIDESGYFITDIWWENNDTIAVMSMGEKVTSPKSASEFIRNAVYILSGRIHGDYAKGIAAYDAWKKAISDDNQFPKNAIMPIMIERLMCQGDAMDCLADGRSNASSYFNKLSLQYPDQPLYKKIAGQFGIVSENAHKMYETLGGWQRGEQQMKALTEPNIRGKLCGLIDNCKEADENALGLLKKLI